MAARTSAVAARASAARTTVERITVARTLVARTLAGRTTQARAALARKTAARIAAARIPVARITAARITAARILAARGMAARSTARDAARTAKTCRLQRAVPWASRRTSVREGKFETRAGVGQVLRHLRSQGRLRPRRAYDCPQRLRCGLCHHLHQQQIRPRPRRSSRCQPARRRLRRAGRAAGPAHQTARRRAVRPHQQHWRNKRNTVNG